MLPGFRRHGPGSPGCGNCYPNGTLACGECWIADDDELAIPPPVTPDDFRPLALAVSGAVNASRTNRPDFRVGNKLFATLDVLDAAWGMLPLTQEPSRDFRAGAPDVFRLRAGGWGQRGATREHSPVARAARVKAGLLLARADVTSAASARKVPTRKP